jgi:hypothetical protein
MKTCRGDAALNLEALPFTPALAAQELMEPLTGPRRLVNGVPNSVLLAKPFAPAQLVPAVSNLLN